MDTEVVVVLVIVVLAVLALLAVVAKRSRAKRVEQRRVEAGSHREEARAGQLEADRRAAEAVEVLRRALHLYEKKENLVAAGWARDLLGQQTP